MTIIYLHGFRSVGTSKKSEALRAAFGDENVFSPDLPVKPAEVEKLVENIIQNAKSYPIIFVGTSLGGFWADYFAQKWDAPCVLVNPAMKPSKSLQEYVGVQHRNFVTAEPVIVNPKDLEEYAAREKYLKENTNGALINLFAAEDDKVIDVEETKEEIPYAVFSMFTMDGGHRFEKYWNDVVVRIRNILEQKKC